MGKLHSKDTPCFKRTGPLKKGDTIGLGLDNKRQGPTQRYDGVLYLADVLVGRCRSGTPPQAQAGGVTASDDCTSASTRGGNDGAGGGIDARIIVGSRGRRS